MNNDPFFDYFKMMYEKKMRQEATAFAYFLFVILYIMISFFIVNIIRSPCPVNSLAN